MASLQCWPETIHVGTHLMMARLVAFLVDLRRGVRRGLPLLLVILLAGAFAFRGRPPALDVGSIVLGVFWTLCTVRTLTRPRRGPLHHLERGFLGAVLVAGLVAASGGSLPACAASYLFMTVVGGAFHPGVTLAVGALMLSLEVATFPNFLWPDFSWNGSSTWRRAEGPSGFGLHAAATLGFGFVHAITTRLVVARTRVQAKKQVSRAIERLQDEARSYRLLGTSERTESPPSAIAPNTHRDLAIESSAAEIHQSVHYALLLLRRSLGLRSAILLWKNDAGTHFRVSEVSSELEGIDDAPLAANEGLFGALSREHPVLAFSPPPGNVRLPYYAPDVFVGAVLAHAVFEGDVVRGIIVVDREPITPITSEEGELVASAAHYCHRAIQNERVFVQLQRAKVEQGKLYRAAQALGAALTERDVLLAGVRAAREIASFDLSAVTVYDAKKKLHEVCAATSRDGEIDDIVGLRFRHNRGLVSMVVENKFPLPYKGDFDPAHQMVLTRNASWPKMPSLLVLPLVLHDRALGTLILGAWRPRAFGDSVRPTLEVLASHLAVSLVNARMVHKLETMATTDGLTGLLNKRAMLDAASQKLQAAARFGRKLSVLVFDLDFFKKVNDTYGHDVGDKVIIAMAQVLKEKKRATDAIARFGGEEFVALCEETDEAGAMLLAERIRAKVEQMVINTDSAPLRITCSVGVATFPDAGSDWDAVFKCADEALYLSKRGGRNRVTAWVPRMNSEPYMPHGQTPKTPPTKRAAG